MKELLEFMVKSLVDNKEAVMIKEESRDDNTIYFEVVVADDEKGKIIGKGGKTAGSIRTIVKSIAAKSDKRVIIEIL